MTPIVASHAQLGTLMSTNSVRAAPLAITRQRHLVTTEQTAKSATERGATGVAGADEALDPAHQLRSGCGSASTLDRAR